MNEALLLGSVVLIYGMVLLLMKLFGKVGLYVMTAICAILANIEVALSIHAFGLDQTLGNVLFAASFLVTDILSEVYGKKEANRAVYIGVVISAFFLILAKAWLLFVPLDSAMGAAFAQVFGNTPRILLASFLVYAVSQRLDVFLYHAWWKWTTKWSRDSKRFLWVRNNGSTLISQLVNTVLFTAAAFYGVMEGAVLLQLILASYVIFIVTSLLDTPVVYWARKIRPNEI